LNFAVTAIGRDRPGIVAAITGALFDAGGNVDDSQMSILHGHFAVMLIVDLPFADESDPGLAELREQLVRVGESFGLGGVTISPVSGLGRGTGPTHMLTVYGADRPGIVRDTSELLASLGVNITDLRTRRTGSDDSPLYTLMVEVSVPGDPEVLDRLSAGLGRLGRSDQVETRLAELETELL